METIALLKKAFRILVVFVVETWIVKPELRSRCPGDPEKPDYFWKHSEGVGNHH